jgi:ectoine hydroxylase-related dioxygenase (phytanoyl-CoA dioxygenase family)
MIEAHRHLGTAIAPLGAIEIADYQRDGFVVARELLDGAEVAEIAAEATRLHRDHLEPPGCFTRTVVGEGSDPLASWPQMMHPHRQTGGLMRYLLHPKIQTVLKSLLGEAPIGAQSMFYWKPQGARGQALHQDNVYFNVHPGTCIAAWVAIDPANRENGRLNVVPGSQAIDLFCTEEADPGISFTHDFVPVPSGLPAVPTDLVAGDVLFFGGNLIHGPGSNVTVDRFRRSFICQYLGASARELSLWYRPIFRFDGTGVGIGDATGGGPCGDVAVARPH